MPPLPDYSTGSLVPPSCGYNYRTGGEEFRRWHSMPDTPQPAPRNTAGDSGSVVEFPGTSRGGRTPLNNLPLQLSSFIGSGAGGGRGRDAALRAEVADVDWAGRLGQFGRLEPRLI